MYQAHPRCSVERCINKSSHLGIDHAAKLLPWIWNAQEESSLSSTTSTWSSLLSFFLRTAAALDFLMTTRSGPSSIRDSTVLAKCFFHGWRRASWLEALMVCWTQSCLTVAVREWLGCWTGAPPAPSSSPSWLPLCAAAGWLSTLADGEGFRSEYNTHRSSQTLRFPQTFRTGGVLRLSSFGERIELKSSWLGTCTEITFWRLKGKVF